jgi:predicted transcriptional regulator
MSSKMESKKRLILMSIRSTYAQAIYAGTKRYEYRRVKVGLAQGDRVLIYECSPIAQVTGVFDVGNVFVGSTQEILNIETNDTIRAAVTNYLKGARIASAIEVVHATKWRRGLEISQILQGVRPPQSYMFLPETLSWDFSP